ncbi:hypothetical protein MNEG_8613 [Monoraphidium neglectum]|uniref:Uncharacterized protein n=1 Tax=Monoraphidium neglectum TaxID=145388 RepID=A0A0D2MYV7_9CHLO|nr:hypothetical protein MNEG_8613 [Monoraphidium neglectum]KIY99345.1 hypothetical protein MNEG_8613 [Monoraphidium neglectum]|eukprot:XP_013898365.1 hypothetical protein MNEG_8613 [Monoraphidium neglectum]
MTQVDPVIGAGSLQLPPTAAGAKLTKKVENDIHCDHLRDTMSPLYRPVPQSLNISTAAGVKDYFPNLAQVVMVDEDEPLQFMHTVWRAKVVWTVIFQGVVGEANLVIKYNTSFEDAVAGTTPKNGELSLRIRREAAGPTSVDRMWRALDAVAGACQAFRNEGWDGKTGPWEPNPTPGPSPDPSPTPEPKPEPSHRPSPVAHDAQQGAGTGGSDDVSARKRVRPPRRHGDPQAWLAGRERREEDGGAATAEER